MTIINPSKEALNVFLGKIFQRKWSLDGYNDDLEVQAENEEPDYHAPPTPDQWQEFKRKFVDEYGGSKIGTDGLSHVELLEYMKSGYRENAEFFDNWFKDKHGNWCWEEDEWP